MMSGEEVTRARVRAAPTGKAHRPLARVRRYWWKYGYGYLFILPAVMLYAVLVIYPFFQSVGLSFTDWDGAERARQFIGLSNYQELLHDPRLHAALRHNAIWMIGMVLVPSAIALILAVLVWSGTRGTLVFRTVYFLPQIMPVVVIGFVWSWIYNPQFGILNRILKTIGLGFLARGWLGDFNLALFAVMGTATWVSIGFDFVLYMAGLQSVDADLLDAARIDGSNSMQTFWYVVVPQLANVVTLISVLHLINALKVFDIVWIMTGGGPAMATEVLATHIYEQAFRWSRVGYATALSTVLTVLALITSIVFMRVRERED